MKVAIRADASVQIGTGHVMRCLNLADELRRQGHRCLFICRPHAGHLGEEISGRGFSVHWLQKPAGRPDPVSEEPLTHSRWLGTSWEADADETLVVLEGQGIDWLVVDHYSLDFRWETQVYDAASYVLAIDDLADRHHRCDMLLDQNVLGESVGNKYEGLIDQSCTPLFGPGYALLGWEYRLLASLLPDRPADIIRVLVFVGGSDPFHLTETYLEALTTSPFRHLYVDVVLGKNYPATSPVRQRAARSAGTRIYTGLPSLAGLMMRADLMLGGGGATNWERFCLGLPAIVTSIADNQDMINQTLADQGLIRFLGKVDTVTKDEICRALVEVSADPVALTEQSCRIRQLVDGKGTGRVVEKMNMRMESK